jgi:prophage antirepressor-like protein
MVKSLGYTDVLHAKKYLKISMINKIKFNQMRVCGLPHTLTIQPHKIFINESGLYEMLSTSTKPLAKIFMNKYFTDIMPIIRKTGKYILDSSSKKELNKINKKLKLTKKSNKQLLINQKNMDYPEGSHIYIIKQKDNNKLFYKIGYTKNLNKRIKIYNTSNANKIYFNYIIKVENKEIDKCIKHILKNKEYIKNKEFYYLNLKTALSFIKKCSNHLNNISCGYCA